MAKEPLSRREFVRRSVLGIVTTAMATRALADNDPAGGNSTSRDSTDAPALPELAAEIRTEAEQRYAAILARRGERLSEKQREEMRYWLYLSMSSLPALRAFPLTNADEPALVLRPYRKGA